MKVTLKQHVSGQLKTVKLGFSWTTLFFGLFVPLLRGDFKWAAIMLVLAIITCGISWLVMPFIYNKKYVQDLLSKGYVPADDIAKSNLAKKGIMIA